MNRRELLSLALKSIPVILIPSRIFAARPVKFEFIEIEGAFQTQVRDINNLGDISGTYFSETISPRGFIRKASGQIIPISFPNSLATHVSGIDDAGNVVGYYAPNQFELRPFVRRNGQYIPLPIVGNVFDIDGDRVVGFTSDQNGIRGFIFTDVLVQFDFPGASETLIYSINNGIIAGRYGDVNGSHGFIHENEQFQSIDFPGVNTRSTEVYAASDNAVIGAVWGGGCQFEPFARIRGKYLLIDLPGAQISGINNNGMIAGTMGQKGFIARLDQFVRRRK